MSYHMVMQKAKYAVEKFINCQRAKILYHNKILV
jgi:hypothetical protein